MKKGKKNLYVTPTIKVVSFEVEKGFAGSQESFPSPVIVGGEFRVSGRAGEWYESQEEASHWF